jgi:hypothetical protein
MELTTERASFLRLSGKESQELKEFIVRYWDICDPLLSSLADRLLSQLFPLSFPYESSSVTLVFNEREAKKSLEFIESFILSNDVESIPEISRSLFEVLTESLESLYE